MGPASPGRQHRRVALPVMAVAMAAIAAASAAPTGDPPSPYNCWLEKELAQLYEDVSPAIVSVVSYRTSLHFGTGDGAPSYSLRRLAASGVVVGVHGCVAVPARVAQPGDSIVVHFPGGKHAPARYQGTDPATRIAVLHLTGGGTFPHLEPPDEGESTLPEWVAAVAYGPWRGPQPGWPTLTLSQRAAIEPFETRYEDTPGELWRLHAPIAPGNQGGALVSLSGTWVGLIIGAVTGVEGTRRGDPVTGRLGTRRADVDEGVIVPAATVMRAIQEIESGQRALAGFLGVRTRPVVAGAPSPAQSGVLVAEVLPDSPAERYGIRPSDQILRFDGQPVSSVDVLSRLVQAAKPGQVADVDIRRAGADHRLRICVGDGNAVDIFLSIRRDHELEEKMLRRELQMIMRRLQLMNHAGPEGASD